ncbi:MAG: gamma-glutamyl-gamma-aminobutyrate hydrolase family protein [Candidatus Paceibacterota bacterium]
MKKNQIVGITQRVTVNKNGVRCDTLEQNYSTYFSALGVTLIPIPNDLTSVSSFIESTHMSKLIFSGGGDIDPDLYGGKRKDPASYTADRERTEKELFAYAQKSDMPVLGICRGAQMINVLSGGKLLDLRETYGPVHGHVKTFHDVEIVAGLITGLPKGPAKVNSYHDFGFTKKELGQGLVAFAKAKDGIVEGIGNIDKKIYGILWHPERDGIDREELTKKIIEAFLSDT